MSFGISPSDSPFEWTLLGPVLNTQLPSRSSTPTQDFWAPVPKTYLSINIYPMTKQCGCGVIPTALSFQDYSQNSHNPYLL